MAHPRTLCLDFNPAPRSFIKWLRDRIGIVLTRGKRASLSTASESFLPVVVCPCYSAQEAEMCFRIASARGIPYRVAFPNDHALAPPAAAIIVSSRHLEIESEFAGCVVVDWRLRPEDPTALPETA